MAIDKMTFIDIKGNSADLDQVLIQCVLSGLFHPENAAKFSEYSIGSSTLTHNAFSELYGKMGDIAGTVGIPLGCLSCGCNQPEITEPNAFLEKAGGFFALLQNEYPSRLGEQTHLEEELRKAPSSDRPQLTARLGELKASTMAQREEFSHWYAQLTLLHDAWELRKYAVEVRGVFHVVGFVASRTREEFLQRFHPLSGITITPKDVDKDLHLPVPIPVKLKNNWFVRPFEMFVEMYGSPSYNDIDPTPFVGYTYTALFGMMFGDLGQGLLIILLGALLWKLKGMKLGAVMTRIGFSSSLFGIAYGSVFGYEELLTPLYTRLFGWAEKPIEVMRPSITNIILLSSIGIGVAIIFMIIVFNICIGIKQHSFERAVLSQNGIAGLLFYGSVLSAVLVALSGGSTPVVCWIIIAASLVMMFFKEPLGRLMDLMSHSTLIDKSEYLKESRTFRHSDFNISKLFSSENFFCRFGRLPTENFQKLDFYDQTPFIVNPVKTDVDYVWCLYLTASSDKEEVDAIFHDLFFERIYVPEDCLASNEETEQFLRRCIEEGGLPSDVTPNPKYKVAKAVKRRTILQVMFPDGIGAFLIETVFEMFEVLLSFVTNTMSFLRVGGFILSHAGMMSVVMTLSAMVGGAETPNLGVVIGGNIFVMCLEGLIVGIQVLRLEFYEIFSRFFEADGEPFLPVHTGKSAG